MKLSFTKIVSLPILFLLCSFSGTFAQIAVTGSIIDEYGDPMIGVNVVLKEDPAKGTTTDIDGKFEIDIPSEQTNLLFQYLGYKDQEILVGTQRNLTIKMITDAAILETVEVVKTALGAKRQKREIGYSAESIDGGILEVSNTSNVLDALSGRSAGVQITAPNGVDGGTTRITIRGNNNITGNNQPLIIVDGVPLENSAGMENIGRGVDWGSAINNINPADIEDMTILKGPTAAALYGSRGSNGVILITTKRGEKRKGIGVDYSVQHRVIQPFRYRDVQNIYGMGAPSTFLEPTLPTNDAGQFIHPNNFYPNEGPLGEPTTSSFGFYGTGISWGPKMDGQMIEWWDGEMRAFSPQPDNLKLFFDNGNTTTHNLSFSGGSEMGTMRVSLTRLDHNAIIPNSNYNQTTVNIGSTLNISSKVKADISINYINYHRLNSPTLGDDQLNSFSKGVLYSFPRSYKGLEKEINILPDGTRNNYDGQYPFLYSGPHIWWNTFNNNTTLDRNKLIGALALTYEVTDWLNVTGRLGMDFTLNQFETRNRPIDNLGILEGFYSNELNRDLVRNNEFLVTAYKDKIFDSPFGIKFSVGGAQWGRNQYGIKGQSGGTNVPWTNPWLNSFSNADRTIEAEVPEDQIGEPTVSVSVPSQFIPTEIRYAKKINSLFGFLNLNYSDYLFLEITGRNDWTSSLPINNNDYFYPSVSLSFLPSEAFDLKLPWLSFWKVRGAYAQTASDTDPFQVDKVFDIGAFGGNQTASLQSTIPPLDLRPQRATSYEFGTTIGLLEDKINIDFTYYYISSFDQILDAPLPSSSGASNIRINTGELENKGIEAILNIDLIQTRNFFWETGFNISRNRNKVVSLGDSGAEILELADIWGLNGPAIAVREGEDYGTILGYDHIYHENGQPIVNDGGTHYLFTQNRVPVGNASPDFTGGWSMRLGFKGLTLSTLVDTKWGGDIYSGTYVTGLQNGQSPTTLIERQGGGLPYTDPDGNVRNVGIILDGVLSDGSQNTQVVHYLFKYVPNAGGWGRWLTTPGIIENSWIKLREVNLTYRFSESLTQKTKVFQKLSISLVGRDLAYLYTTLPDKINPEGGNGSGNAQGLEWASFPGIRSFGFSLNASF